MKVSFDFDSTLDREQVQEYAKDLLNRGIEVWIVTSRFPDKRDWNKDLMEVATRLGIPKERIVFTAMVDKCEFFKDKDFVWHLDDDEEEVSLINERTNTVGIDSWNQKDWRQECEDTIWQYKLDSCVIDKLKLNKLIK